VVFSNTSIDATQSGTWTVTLSDNTVYDTQNQAIKTAVESIDGNITACNTGDVTVSTLPDVSLSDITYADTVCEVTLTDTSTWYSWTAPSNCVAFQASARFHYDWQMSIDSNGNQYQLIPAGGTAPPAPAVREGYISGTYYFKCEEKTNQVIQIWARYKQ
jgi:hypothetical protein